MPAKNLNDRFVASVRRNDVRTNYFDTKVKGLTLRVSTRGAKSWCFVYRLAGKPSQWLLLGSYPAMPLVDARKTALGHRHTVDVDGHDPVEMERAAAIEQSKPSVFTFADLVPVYLAFARSRKKTWRDDAQKINKYLIPAWGTRPLQSITRRHVHELLDTLIGQGMSAGVNRVQAVISRMFTVALDRSLVDAHPAARMLKRATEQPRTRVLTDNELRALWRGLAGRPGMAADVVWLRLLLGQRLEEELMMMRWDELDLDAGIWTIPRERTKNQKQSHVVPLSATSLTLLKRRRKAVAKDEPRVFPDLNRFHDDYRALADLRTDYEWTDLRRTVATRIAALGYSETTIGRVLNHAKHTVTARHYNQHQYDVEKRQALDAWDRELQGIISGERPKTAKVRTLKRA